MWIRDFVVFNCKEERLFEGLRSIILFVFFLLILILSNVFEFDGILKDFEVLV